MGCVSSKRNYKEDIKIKVIHMLDDLDAGGIQSFILNSYDEIERSDGIRFDFLLCRHSERDEELVRMGSKVYYIPNIRDVGYFRYKKKIKQFFVEHKEYDVVHIHYTILAGLIAEIISKFSDIKVISHAHNARVNLRLSVRILKKISQKKVAKYSHARVACSNEAARSVFGDDIKNVKIVKNPVNLRKFAFDEKKRIEKRRELGIPNNSTVIGHVGRMIGEKNQSFLIDVFYEYIQSDPDSRLLLIGGGPDFAAIKRKISRLKLDDLVLDLGDKRNIKEYYDAMDYFVFPSKTEGLGIALIEAQLNGLSCFASNDVPKAADITREVSFLSLDLSVKEWANRIYKHNLSRSKTNRSFNVASNYDATAETKKLIDLYNDLACTKKKILHYIPGYNYGGIETFTYGLNKELKDKCYFYYLVEKDIPETSLGNLEKLGARILRIPNMTKESYWGNFSAIKKILKNNRFDVVQVHDCNNRFFVMLMAKIYGVKCRIYHMHSRDIKGNFLVKSVKKIGVKLNILFSTICVACSDDVAKAKGVCDYILISNFVKAKDFKYSKQLRDQIRKKYHIPKTQIVLLFVGRVEKVKNIDYLLDVVKEIPDRERSRYSVMIVGDGSQLPAIQDKARELNGCKVIFTGKQDDLSAYYSASDCLCLPSFTEGFPIVLLEAQANGLSCIVSSGIPRIAGLSKKVHFVDIKENDKNKWMNLIRGIKFASSEDRLKGVKVVEDNNYDSCAVANKFFEIYSWSLTRCKDE